MTDLRSLHLSELQAELSPLNLPQFRAKQIFDWLQRKGAPDAAHMTNLPKQLREVLDSQYFISACEILRKQVSADGTVKYLFGLHDGESVESVVMNYDYGRSICISTQVGCKMGCVFCASGKNGCSRDLVAGEMLAQVQAAQNDLGEAITRVVLMGMGEPLDNYDNVLRFLRLITSPEGLHMGQRRISLSTSGLVQQMDRLAKEGLGLTLSVSLHAPNDAIRSELMPINRRYPLDELLAACRRYTAATARRISFEYAMLRGVNDSEACAAELAARLKGMLCHVNLIPANEIGNGYQKSTAQQIQAFQTVLERHHIPVTLRRSLGKDISAACGQLKAMNNEQLTMNN